MGIGNPVCTENERYAQRLEISSEIYPDSVKLKKQMSYADSRNIPYIVIAGEEEITNNMVTLR